MPTGERISFGPSRLPWPSYNHNHPFEADMTGVCDFKVAPNSSNQANTTFQHFTEVSLFKSAGDLQGNLYFFCVCFFFRYIISTSTSVHLLVEKKKKKLRSFSQWAATSDSAADMSSL